MNVDIASTFEAIARRWYVMVAALLLGVGAAFLIGKHSKQFVANSAVILTSQGDVTAPSSGGTAETVAAGLSIQPSDLPVLIQSENVLSSVARDMGNNVTVSSLRRQIRAHVGLQNDVMPIEFSATDPDQAVFGANAVADELTHYYQTIATARFSSLIVDLQKQIQAKQATLAHLDSALQRTIAKDPNVAAKDPSAVAAQFTSLQSDRDQLAAAIKGDQEVVAYGSRLTAETLPLAQQEIGNLDPAYQALRTQYAKDTAELNRIRAAYSPSYPGLPELQDQVAREAQQVAAADAKIRKTTPLQSQSYNSALKLQLQATGQEQADRARIAQIDAQIAALRSSVTARTGSSVKAESLRRERESAASALSALQARLAEADADRAVAGSLGSIAVISRAENAELATWSKPKVVLMATLVAAFWLGLLVIAVLEYFNRSLRSLRQIEGLYGVPVLTTVGAALNGQFGRQEYLELQG